MGAEGLVNDYVPGGGWYDGRYVGAASGAAARGAYDYGMNQCERRWQDPKSLKDRSRS